MTITVYNPKGGVGKSPISALIAKELDYKILTNDDSTNEDYLDIVEFQEKINIKNRNNIVVDLGGWIDSNTLDILKVSDVVLIPFNSKPNAIKRTIALIHDLKQSGISYNLIFTMFETPQEFDKTMEKFKLEDIEVDYKFPKTKLLDVLIEKNLKLADIKKDKTLNNWFKNHTTIFKELIFDLKGI